MTEAQGQSARTAPVGTRRSPSRRAFRISAGRAPWRRPLPQQQLVKPPRGRAGVASAIRQKPLEEPHDPSFGPAAALFDARAGRRVPVFRVAGVLREQRAGKLRVLAAVGEPPCLTALGNRTFAMEGVSAGLKTASTGKGLPKLAASAPQAAARFAWFLHVSLLSGAAPHMRFSHDSTHLSACKGRKKARIYTAFACARRGNML